MSSEQTKGVNPIKKADENESSELEPSQEEMLEEHDKWLERESWEAFQKARQLYRLWLDDKKAYEKIRRKLHKKESDILKGKVKRTPEINTICIAEALMWNVYKRATGESPW